MFALLLLFFVALIPTTTGAGGIYDPDSVEKKYGKEMVRDLARLYSPPADRHGLVTPRPKNSDWSDTPQAVTYRSWTANAMGPENYRALNRLLNVKAKEAAASPEIAPIRELIRQTFTGRLDSIPTKDQNFFRPPRPPLGDGQGGIRWQSQRGGVQNRNP